MMPGLFVSVIHADNEKFTVNQRLSLSPVRGAVVPHLVNLLFIVLHHAVIIIDLLIIKLIITAQVVECGLQCLVRTHCIVVIIVAVVQLNPLYHLVQTLIGRGLQKIK